MLLYGDSESNLQQIQPAISSQGQTLIIRIRQLTQLKQTLHIARDRLKSAPHSKLTLHYMAVTAHSNTATRQPPN